MVSDAAHRQHHLQGAAPDWDGFFGACHLDEPIESGLRLVDALDPGLTVVLCTARPDWVLDRTVEWLDRHAVRRDLLALRPSAMALSSPRYKSGVLDHLRRAGFEVTLAFDDDRRNVDMFVGAGVPTVYIHSGYYD